MKKLCFVEFRLPNEVINTQEKKAIRRHVRNAVLAKRRCSHLDTRIRHSKFVNLEATTISVELSEHNETLRREENAETSSKHVIAPQRPTHTAGCVHNGSQADPEINHRNVLPSLSVFRPSVHHPYTTYAGSVVELPVDRVDALLKGRKSLLPRP